MKANGKSARNDDGTVTRERIVTLRADRDAVFDVDVDPEVKCCYCKKKCAVGTKVMKYTTFWEDLSPDVVYAHVVCHEKNEARG